MIRTLALHAAAVLCFASIASAGKGPSESNVTQAQFHYKELYPNLGVTLTFRLKQCKGDKSSVRMFASDESSLTAHTSKTTSVRVLHLYVGMDGKCGSLGEEYVKVQHAIGPVAQKMTHIYVTLIGGSTLVTSESKSH